MKAYEVAFVSAHGSDFAIVRVGRAEFENQITAGHIMAMIERDHPRHAVLMESSTGQMLSHPQHLRRLRGFDPKSAKWTQWNMEE